MTIQTISDTVTLADGNQMPLLGFGVYKLTTTETMQPAIKAAYDTGYRLFDTAQLYGNEALLGQTLVDLQLPRQSLFLTTKVAEQHQGFDQTCRSIETSLSALQVDYLDLVLIHWPIHTEFFSTWQALERLKQEKLVRSIGVSNYHQTHLELLATKAHELPVVNQVENHPYLSQPALINYHEKNQIKTQAWSPLGRGKLLTDPLITKLATAYGKSAAQIILRWHLQRGVAIIPKSQNPNRIIENGTLYDFTLSTEAMQQLNALNQNQRTGRDPELVYELGYQY